jgi:hypothetical protein
VEYSVGRAELVRQAIAFHAVTGLAGAAGIVQAGVNHAAVARTRDHAELRQLFEQKDVRVAGGELHGHGAAHHATADNHYIG